MIENDGACLGQTNKVSIEYIKGNIMMVIQWRALTHELPWRGFDTISENRRDIYK